MTISTPRSSNQTASATVVADAMMRQPAAFTRAKSVGVRQAKMKTHYFRLGSLDDPTSDVIKRWNIYLWYRNLRINAEFTIVRQQAVSPSLFAISSGFCLDMTKEVDINRLVSQPAQRADRLGCELRFHRGAADRTETSSGRNGCGEINCANACHWR